mgnify:CR=1 FL=1
MSDLIYQIHFSNFSLIPVSTRNSHIHKYGISANCLLKKCTQSFTYIFSADTSRQTGDHAPLKIEYICRALFFLQLIMFYQRLGFGLQGCCYQNVIQGWIKFTYKKAPYSYRAFFILVQVFIISEGASWQFAFYHPHLH